MELIHITPKWCFASGVAKSLCSNSNQRFAECEYIWVYFVLYQTVQELATPQCA
jgi:hypothetical protein